MSELKLYEISEKYISYISTVEKYVFSAKESDRNHTRKYLGVVYSIASGELELKGTLKLSNMIPVPASELTLYDMEHERDLFYKSLIHKEMLFIRKNKNMIIRNAEILYKQKKENSPAIGYLKNTVDFSLLEQMHDKFIEKKKN